VSLALRNAGGSERRIGMPIEPVGICDPVRADCPFSAALDSGCEDYRHMGCRMLGVDACKAGWARIVLSDGAAHLDFATAIGDLAEQARAAGRWMLSLSTCRSGCLTPAAVRLTCSRGRWQGRGERRCS
jgi:hypothetical protein